GIRPAGNLVGTAAGGLSGVHHDAARPAGKSQAGDHDRTASHSGPAGDASTGGRDRTGGPNETADSDNGAAPGPGAAQGGPSAEAERVSNNQSTGNAADSSGGPNREHADGGEVVAAGVVPAQSTGSAVDDPAGASSSGKGRPRRWRRR